MWRVGSGVVLDCISTSPYIFTSSCRSAFGASVRTQRDAHGLPVETRIGPESGIWMSLLLLFRCIRTCDVCAGASMVSVAIVEPEGRMCRGCDGDPRYILKERNIFCRAA